MVTSPPRLDFSGFLGFAPLPDEACCKVCGWFDVTVPEVKKILSARVQGDEQKLGRLLYQAQCKCRTNEEKRVSREALRWGQANLPKHPARLLSNFDVVPGTSFMFEAAKTLCEAKDGTWCLVLSGPVGVGKSHMLEAVCRSYLAAGRTARYEMVSSFLDRLRSTYGEASKEDVYEMLTWYGSRGILALDDLGLERATEWAVEKLVAIVDQRIRDRMALVVSTNRSESEMRAYSARLASRLFGDSEKVGDVRVVKVVAKDYRERR